MKAEEIREQTQALSSALKDVLSTEAGSFIMQAAQVDLIGELTAQVAEVNERMAKRDNPLYGVDVETGKITMMEPYATLRDQFAMAALQGEWASQGVGITDRLDFGYWTPAGLAERAKQYYQMADAMLEARKK